MTSHRSSKSALFRPEDFAAVLATEEPLFVVGGQAVNLWALYYQHCTAHMTPFVSQDIDVLGNRHTLVQVAKLAKPKPHFFPMRPPTNEIGVVMVRTADNRCLPE